jgi:hypothetical protein
VQKHYGIEPMGLLRWADMAPDDLIAAMEHALEGVGDPENTILSPPQDGGDWVVADARYNMKSHTFLRDEDTEATRARVFDATCRRLQYLSRNMLEDIATGEKIFVYKLTYENLDRDRLFRLHRAIRMHGPATLLYVRQSDATHPPGTVVIEAPGLMVGYIKRFVFEFGPNPKYLGPSPESWAPVVQEAHRLWRGAHAGATSMILTEAAE